MSIGGNHAPLLILSNSIYAKRRDGSFYPGSIESKHDGSYTVKFADGARERIREENLTWLGFWGLPPWSWPKSPVIQPVVSSWEAFESQAMFVGDNTASYARSPASHTKRRTEQTRLFHEANEAVQSATSHGSNSGQSSEEHGRFPSHLLPEPTDSNQPRSSVLRISSNALSKEGNLDDFFHLRDLSKEGSKSSESPKSSHPSTQNSYRETRADHGRSCASSSESETQSVIANGRLAKDLEFHRLSEKATYHYLVERSATERGVTHPMENEEMSLTDGDSDYHTEEVQNFTYSRDCPPLISPPHFITSQFPFFGKQFGVTMVGGTPHAAIPSSFRLQMKARRKDEKKKCRKVYGIENRHFWCTQCKWKKACTRFGTGSKVISNGLV